MTLPRLLLISLCLTIPVPAFAWTSTWTTIVQVSSGATNDRIIVKLADEQDDAGNDDCATDDYSVILVPTDSQYDDDFRMVMGAMLSGKQVQFSLSSCDNSYLKVTYMRICVDGTSCGQS